MHPWPPHKLIEAYITLPPRFFRSPGENWWMTGMTNKGPLHSPPLLSPLSFPPCCLLCHPSWPFYVQDDRVDGPWALSGDGWLGVSPLLFASDNNGGRMQAVALHQQWWMAVIVSLKKTNLGRARGWTSLLRFSLCVEIWCSRCPV